MKEYSKQWLKQFWCIFVTVVSLVALFIATDSNIESQVMTYKSQLKEQSVNWSYQLGKTFQQGIQGYEAPEDFANPVIEGDPVFMSDTTKNIMTVKFVVKEAFTFPGFSQWLEE